jgi:hypothetical protein
MEDTAETRYSIVKQQRDLTLRLIHREAAAGDDAK